MNTFSQALSDEQVLHRNMVVELRHPSGASTQGQGNPIKLSRNNEESFSPAPLLGEHTDEVFTSLLGYDVAKLAQLRAAGAIG